MDADVEEGHEHIDGDQSCNEPREQTDDEENATDELGVGGDVAEPIRQVERGDVVGVVIERAVGYDFSVAVDRHGDTECEAHEQGAKGLQAVEPFRHKEFS